MSRLRKPITVVGITSDLFQPAFSGKRSRRSACVRISLYLQITEGVPARAIRISGDTAQNTQISIRRCLSRLTTVLQLAAGSGRM
jgi:hypothetical protein